jgi:DNA-binding response OmpR family regulator
VVDDEQDLNFTLKEILDETGLFQVETFTNPVLALSEFRACVYDLAVLDIRMPKMNGFQMYRKLIDVDNRLKVCFLTATELLYYRDTDSDVINDLGTDCFVPKPINTIDLINKLKVILSK